MSFPSRFTVPRWMARPPVPCPGLEVAPFPPLLALPPRPHSSAWLLWAVALLQRSEDRESGYCCTGERPRPPMQALGVRLGCWDLDDGTPSLCRVRCSPRMALAASLATWQPHCRTSRPSANWLCSRRVSGRDASPTAPWGTPFPTFHRMLFLHWVLGKSRKDFDYIPKEELHWRTGDNGSGGS